MQRKCGRVCILSCLLLLTGGVSGCRPASTSVEVPATPHRGMELRIACPTEATAALLRSYGQAWALRQGTTLHVLRYDPSKETGPQTAGPADIWIIAPAELPRWAAAGQLATVPARCSARDSPYAWTDLLSTYREQLIQWESTPYGLPLVGESPLCCYRRDLLEDAAHKTAFRKQFGHELTAPATWEQFAQIAEYFHSSRRAPRDHSPQPSLPSLPRSDAALDRLFYTVAIGFARRAVPADEVRRADHRDDVFSFHYDMKTGQPRIDAPGFVYALKRLQRLQTCRPVEPADSPEEAFRAGRAVLCLTDAPRVKMFQKTPALHDKIGVCRIPGGECYFDFTTGKLRPTPEGNRLPYLGGAGWLAVVPRASERAEAAFDLLAELTGPKTSTQIFLGANTDGGPIRSEHLYRERWDSFDLDEKAELTLRQTLQETLLHRGLKNPALCLRTPRQAAHRAVLVKEIRDALRKQTDAAKALGKVAEAWKKLDRQQGLDAHTADYRRSLGLLSKW